MSDYKNMTSSNLSEMPLITVITVVLNGKKHLEQAMLSVLNQSYANIEYLVIDGGSTDGTLEIIREYQDRIDYWISEPDNGIYDAMNKGIRLAKGELIGLLNADDYYEPDALRIVAQRYDRNAPGVYYGHTYMIDEELKIRYAFYSSMRPWRGMSVGHQAMFVHRRIYETVGSYDVKFRFAADYDFFLRTITKGVRYISLDVFLVNYRSSGRTGNNLYRALNEGRIINKSCFRALSKIHLIYLLLFIKSILLNEVQKILPKLLGKRNTEKLKIYYLEKFIAENNISSYYS